MFRRLNLVFQIGNNSCEIVDMQVRNLFVSLGHIILECALVISYFRINYKSILCGFAVRFILDHLLIGLL